MRTKHVVQQHDHSHARRIKQSYDDSGTDFEVRTYSLKRKDNNGRLRAKLPTDGTVLHVAKRRIITHCPESPKKRRKTRMRLRHWVGRKKKPKLDVDGDSKVLAVNSQFAIVEKRKRKKKATRLRSFRLREATGFGSFGPCFKVKLPKRAKILYITKRRVVVRMPRKPGKFRKRRFLAVPLVDKGQLRGCRYYTATIPEGKKIVGLSRKGMLFVRVGKKCTEKADEKWFVGVVDDGTIPEGRNIGVLKHRKLGFGPTYLLPD